MRLPRLILKPEEIDPRNKNFAGPYAIGFEQISKMFPGLLQEFVTLQVGPQLMNGGVSYQEFALLAALVRWARPRKVLEIGTFYGWTTHNFALQLDSNTEVVTVDLPDGVIGRLEQDGWNERYIPTSIITPIFLQYQTQDRIRRVRADTADLTVRELGDGFEFIFIDGAHSAVYIENDTRLALEVAAEQAIIIWHDYGKARHWPGVIEFLHNASRKRTLYPLYWPFDKSSELETSLVMFIRGNGTTNA